MASLSPLLLLFAPLKAPGNAIGVSTSRHDRLVAILKSNREACHLGWIHSWGERRRLRTRVETAEAGVIPLHDLRCKQSLHFVIQFVVFVAVPVGIAATMCHVLR